jgi:hypothetical protein
MSVYGTELAKPALRPKAGYCQRKPTLGRPASLPRHRGRSKALGLIANVRVDSLDEAKAAFRATGSVRNRDERT